jgi:hypothetical protein
MSEENINDVCAACLGKDSLFDIPKPMCGKEEALFYVLHKSGKSLTGKYQSVDEKTCDVYCLYKKEK